MNPWIVLLLVMAAVVFALDYLVRRKKWGDNSKEEKISLLLNMFTVGPYAFLSVLGLFWELASGRNPETPFGEVLYEVTLFMGTTYFIVAAIAIILSFILRKTGKTKASIWTNIIALLYIVAVLTVNHFAEAIL